MGGKPLVGIIKGMINMYCLLIKWDYEYDKEGTWFDTDSGEERYELLDGADYPLPHIRKKLTVREITQDGDTIRAELYADHQTATVCSGGDPVILHVSDSYSVCGDSVHQSLSLKITVEKQ